MDLKLWVITVAIFTLIRLTRTEPSNDAENVCTTKVHTKKDIRIETPVEYPIRYAGMCGILPCTKTRIETRIDEKIKTIVGHELQRVCCPGYAETPGRQCAPICLDACRNGGKCVAPNSCRCSPSPGESSPGFSGPTCARFVCPGENSWGSNCDKNCNCPLNAYCGASNGKCICYPGYRGSNCTECERNSQDPECQEIGELPPIVDTDANLIMGGSLPSRQQSEALVLERTPDEALPDDRSSFGANYLVAVLACFTFISLIGFLIIKRRYDKLKNEVCYAHGSSIAVSDAGSGGDYSSSTYYASHPDNMLAKNLSFAAATRQALSGLEGNKNDTQHAHNVNQFKSVVNPLVESHLMCSHKKAEQNPYSDVKVNLQHRPLPNPDQSSTTTQSSETHIYQVPRTCAEANSTAEISISSEYQSPVERCVEDEIYEEINK